MDHFDFTTKSSSYANIVKVLNAYMKGALKGNKKCLVEFKTLMEQFCKERSTPQIEWTFDCNPYRLKDGLIVVMAHSSRPIRALGVVYYDKTIENIEDSYKYNFRKLSIRDNGKEKIYIDSESKKKQSLYTSKRGFWLILNDSIDLNLFWNEKEGVDEKHNPILYRNIKTIYDKYVRGMDVDPEDDVLLTVKRPDLLKEQFMIGTYPNKLWSSLFPIPPPPPPPLPPPTRQRSGGSMDEAVALQRHKKIRSNQTVPVKLGDVPQFEQEIIGTENRAPFDTLDDIFGYINNLPTATSSTSLELSEDFFTTS